MRISLGGKSARILDFDIENRPLSYLGMDYTTSDVTAIACKFVGEPASYCWLLGRDNPLVMLDEFRWMYTQADIVTGHYIRNHDIPILNGALIEHGLKPLPRKITCDTKNDLVGFKGISKSQENLAYMFGIAAPKVHMNTPMWREANRLTPGGLALTEQRVVGDIQQHIQLRSVLLGRGLLKPPKAWG